MNAWGAQIDDSDNEESDNEFDTHPVMFSVELPCAVLPPHMELHSSNKEVIVNDELWWEQVSPLLSTSAKANVFAEVVQMHNFLSLSVLSHELCPFFLITFKPPFTINLRAPCNNTAHKYGSIMAVTLTMMAKEGLLVAVDTPELVDNYSSPDNSNDLDALKQMEAGLPFSERWRFAADSNRWLCVYKDVTLHVMEGENPTHLYTPNTPKVVREYLPPSVLGGVSIMSALAKSTQGKTLIVTDPSRVSLWENMCFFQAAKNVVVSTFMTPPSNMSDFYRVISDVDTIDSYDIPIVWMVTYEGDTHNKCGTVAYISKETNTAPYPISYATVTTHHNKEYQSFVRSIADQVKDDPIKLHDALTRINTALCGGEAALNETHCELPDASECAVCLWEKGDNDPVDKACIPFTNEVILKCGHRFHESCMRNVVSRSTNVCPTCRGSTDGVRYFHNCISSWDMKIRASFEAVYRYSDEQTSCAVIICPTSGAIDDYIQENILISTTVKSSAGQLRIVVMREENVDPNRDVLVVLCGLNIYDPEMRETIRLCMLETVQVDIATRPTKIVQVLSSGTFDDGVTDWHRELYRQVCSIQL
jgi:hypothetical protein